MDWLDLLAVQGTLKSLLEHHSSKASILCPQEVLPLHGTWVDSTASVDPVSTRLHSQKPQASLPSGGVRCEGTLRQGKLRGQDGRGLTPWPLNPQDAKDHRWSTGTEPTERA